MSSSVKCLTRLEATICSRILHRTQVSEIILVSQPKYMLWVLKRTVSTFKLLGLKIIAILRVDFLFNWTYVTSVWDHHYKQDISALEKVQLHRAQLIRGIYYYRESVTSMLHDLDWPPLQHRRRIRDTLHSTRQSTTLYQSPFQITSPLNVIRHLIPQQNLGENHLRNFRQRCYTFQ